MAISPDGKWVAAGHYGGRVALLDASDGERRQFLPGGLGGDAWRLRFSPDGSRLAGVGVDGYLSLWDLPRESGRAVTRLMCRPAVFAQSVGSWSFGITLSWSPTGQRLVVADSDGLLSLWTKSGDLVKRWVRESTESDEAVDWSRDGSVLLTADGSVVQLRDGETGELRSGAGTLGQIRCPSPVIALAAHPTADRLATGHVGCRLIVWDLATGELLRKASFPDPIIPRDDHEIASIAYSPTGARLGVSIRNGCWAFAIDPERLTKVWSSEYLGGHFGEAVRVTWGPDGERLWFAFECGGGELFWGSPGGSQTLLRENSSVPEFGGRIGVLNTGGAVHAVSSDGTLLW